MLVTTHSYDGIRTFDMNTSNLEWRVSGILPGMQEEMKAQGVTTDGRGHIFVSDFNNECVLMFTLDGTYLGALQPDQERGLGVPLWILWSEATSSLIVVHAKENRRSISFVNVQ